MTTIATYVPVRKYSEKETLLSSIYSVGNVTPLPIKNVIMSFWRILTSKVE